MPLTPTRRLQLGVFLIALSGLMFEIGLTRIFSATIWYHFAFVAISVALLGWGLGGFTVHVLKRRLRPSLDKAALLSLAYAAAIPLSLWLIVRTPFRPERLSFYFGVALVPFLLAGAALAMVFTVRRQVASQLYFADLVGASTGALAITLLLSWLGAETAILVVALAPILAAACLSWRLAMAALGGAVALASVFTVQTQEGAFMIRSAPTKGMYRHMMAAPGARPAFTGWNAYSRIDAVTGFPDTLARLYIDADAWTTLHRWDGHVESLQPLRSWYRALPFSLAPPGGRTLVIGPGGGTDVLVALASGAERVTAVEMNPLMLEFVRRFGPAAGGIYDHPQVETQLSEGRTYLSRTSRTFDVIFLGFVDSWASVASGGLSLSENYLYTVEAFQAYLDHLGPDGLLVIMRWNVDVPRLVANAVALLGPAEAASRMAVVIESRGTAEDPPQMIFMLRRRPFTAEETAAIMGWPSARPVVVPGRVAEAPYGDLLAGRTSLAQFDAASDTQVNPVTDDRPFFFARRKPLGLPASMTRAFAQILLPVLAASALVVVLGRPRARGEALAVPYAGSIVFFACLGVGFIAVELALLQNLTLLLGHPIFTLSVLLFTLLAAGGVGARTSDRFSIGRVCLWVAGLSAVYAFALPWAVPRLLPLPLVARIAVGVLLVVPLGFAMGMPFPRGLRRAGQGFLPAPAFYWGLNGVFSVLGSMATIVVAVSLGFRVAMLAGSLCYLLAAAATRSLALASERLEERAA
jgi:predicted membrane-bound spermidine synthase